MEQTYILNTLVHKILKMKKYIVFLMIFFSLTVKAQTVIPASTPISTVGGMPSGTYRYFFPTAIDTMDLSLGKQIHDTIYITKVCPVCPPPVICPPPPKQRTCIGYSYDANTGKTTFLYDDLSKSIKRKEPLK